MHNEHYPQDSFDKFNEVDERQFVEDPNFQFQEERQQHHHHDYDHGRYPNQNYPGQAPNWQQNQQPNQNFPSQFPGWQQPNYPGQFPGGPQQGQGQQQGAPNMAPPTFTPQQPKFQTFAVDQGAIQGCLFRFTYIWLNNNQSFWFYPTFVGRRSVSGFRWQRNRWVYFGIDLRQIQSFQCF